MQRLVFARVGEVRALARGVYGFRGRLRQSGVASDSEAIEAMHGCRALYSRTVHVREVSQGDVIWDGFVGVFAPGRLPEAKHCFAWSYREGGEAKTMAVLEISPIDSPQTAVKAAIAARARQK